MRASPLRWITVVMIAWSSSVEAAQTFPKHWGNPPAIQTRDLISLPGGYGHGSSTLAHWIQQNLDKDKVAGPSAKPRGTAVAKGVTVIGELRQGCEVTFTLDGPAADGAEHDYRVSLHLTHATGEPEHLVRASAVRGPNGERRWQAQFTPKQSGEWNVRVNFTEKLAEGKDETPVQPFHGRSGKLTIAAAPPAER